jgi:hypothetical protein
MGESQISFTSRVQHDRLQRVVLSQRERQCVYFQQQSQSLGNSTSTILGKLSVEDLAEMGTKYESALRLQTMTWDGAKFQDISTLEELIP